MIVVIGGIKGGSGKTTLATNLAVLRSTNHKVLLVDADEQRSSSDWATQRNSQLSACDLTTIQLVGRSVGSETKKLAGNYSDVIVDVGGRDTTSQRSALTIADVFLIPFKPRSLDIWTLGSVKTMVNEVKSVNPNLVCLAVINMADAIGSDNDDAVEILKEWEEVICIPSSIGNRKAFGNAASQGLGVVEIRPADNKAILEITGLYSYVFSDRLISAI